MSFHLLTEILPTFLYHSLQDAKKYGMIKKNRL